MRENAFREQSRTLLALELGVRLWTEVQSWTPEERPKEVTRASFFEYVLPYAKALSWLRHLSHMEGEDTRRDIADRAFAKEKTDDPESTELFAVQTELAQRVVELEAALDLSNLSAKELMCPSETKGMWSLDELAARFLESQGLKEGARWLRQKGKERWQAFLGALELETERSHLLACRSLWWLWENDELIKEEQPPLVLVGLLARGLVKLHQSNFDLIGWNQVSRIVELQHSRHFNELSLGYCAREFVLCGLPYKPIKENEFVRQNGDFRLRVIGSALGVPYGQDRLIILWLASAFQAAGKPAHNRIYVRAASDILRALGIPINGHEMQLLQERLARVFAATYIVEHREKQTDGSLRWVSRRYQLIHKLKMWFDKPEKENQYTLSKAWTNYIELDPFFAIDLREHSLPVDMNTSIALKRSPGVLDFYFWQAWRSFRLVKSGEHEVRVPIFGPNGYWAQSGSIVTDPRSIKILIRRWQKELLTYWPGCPNELTSNAEYIIIRPAIAVPRDLKMNLPGVRRTPPQFAKAPLLLEGPPDPNLPKEPKVPAPLQLLRPQGQDPFPEDE